MQAARDLIHALQNLHPATPFDVGDEQLQALHQLVDIFNTSTKVLPNAAALRVAAPMQQAPGLLHPYNTCSKATQAIAATVSWPPNT